MQGLNKKRHEHLTCTLLQMKNIFAGIGEKPRYFWLAGKGLYLFILSSLKNLPLILNWDNKTINCNSRFFFLINFTYNP